MNRKNKTKNRGLTLIETLLYLALLSVLMVTALPILSDLSMSSSKQSELDHATRDYLFLEGKMRLFAGKANRIIAPVTGQYSETLTFDTENEGRITVRLQGNVPTIVYEDEDETRFLFSSSTRVDRLSFYSPPTNSFERLMFGSVVNGVDFGTTTYFYQAE